MLLTGTFLRSLDEKLRFSIPKPLREALGRPNHSVLYLAPGTDGSLALYAEQVFAQLADQLGRGSPTAQDVRAFSRMFYAQAQRVETDRQGRVRVPQQLAELASLGGEIVLLGVRDHLEIWDRCRWEEYLATKQPSYDQIAESAFAVNRDGVLGGGTQGRPASREVEDGSKPFQPR
jgi:MraZ protein